MIQCRIKTQFLSLQRVPGTLCVLLVVRSLPILPHEDSYLIVFDRDPYFVQVVGYPASTVVRTNHMQGIV